jgi:hypothetical protein
MEKTELEKNIEARASVRVRQEYLEFVSKIESDQIGKKLKIGDKNLASRHTWNAVFHNLDLDKDGVGTNLKEALEIRKNELIKEETKRVLDTVSDIADLLAGRRDY